MRLNDLNNLENVSLDMDATSHNGERVTEVFCDNWENSKKGLELVSAMVKNPIVKLIVSIVISVGDGIQQKICTPTATDNG
jgi:hypothetical protein